MENTPERSFSYPNADRQVPGISDSSAPKKPDDTEIKASEDSTSPATEKRKSVNIFEALETQKRQDNDTQRIRTFQEDIAEAIKHDNLSMIQVAMAEKKRQERQGSPLQLEEESGYKKPLLIGSGVFVALIFLAVGYFFVSNAISPKQDQGSDSAQAALLYTEERVAINIDTKDSDDITRLVKRELDHLPALGEMKGISIVSGTGTSTQEVTAEKFFRSLNSRASDSLLRSMGPRFLLGLYSFSQGDFFLLIKINAYDNAFAGMLQWEPDMENDIGNIMITRKPILPITALTELRSATSTSTSTTPTPAKSPFNARTWVDRVVNNKDARVLIDSDGGPAMLYTFIDKNTLVISSSDKALKEIMFRLTAGRIVR